LGLRSPMALSTKNPFLFSFPPLIFFVFVRVGLLSRPLFSTHLSLLLVFFFLFSFFFFSASNNFFGAPLLLDVNNKRLECTVDAFLPFEGRELTVKRRRQSVFPDVLVGPACFLLVGISFYEGWGGGGFSPSFFPLFSLVFPPPFWAFRSTSSPRGQIVSVGLIF